MKSAIVLDETDPTSQNNHVEFTLQTMIGDTFLYRMSRTTQLIKLMNHLSDLHATDPVSFIFSYEGERLYGEETPNKDGNEASFIIRTNSRLETLMGFYCRQHCLAITGVVFLFNGCLIRAEQTPSELHMMHKDEIYVVSYDQIAHIELKTKCQMTASIDDNDSKLWPDLETKAFINIMVNEVTLGYGGYGYVKSNDVWTSRTDALNFVTKRCYIKEQLKAKMHRLQTMYREFHSLLQNTEFRWNAETNTIAANAEVWQNYLQAHDKTAQFQKKGCDHYKLLEIIFDKNNACRVYHRLPTQGSPNTNGENEFDNEHLKTESESEGHVHVDNDSSDDYIQEVERIKHKGKRKISVKDHKPKKEYTPDQMGDVLAASMARVKRYKGKNVEAALSNSNAMSYCSISKCVTTLEEMEDVSDDIYVKALEKFKDSDWREMFIAMSKDRRRGWLLRL
ncbi:uncharacterized protein LOC131662384 isoform X2 [Vicia villosa]|uniref:uncharacterized protein LOC131662384 isoform X2 n=1 Tax=Vicia villosa TaxID=3911 RepID=UPI00273CF3AD|nr:uncharacterized protein LOC131662384 isoform X2 [Vicia villosa]